MAAYTVINATDTALTNVNAGGDDVPARSYLDGVELTDTELGALLGTAPGTGAVAAILTLNSAPALIDIVMQLLVTVDDPVWGYSPEFYSLGDIDLTTAAGREALRLRRSVDDGQRILQILANGTS